MSAWNSAPPDARSFSMTILVDMEMLTGPGVSNNGSEESRSIFHIQSARIANWEIVSAKIDWRMLLFGFKNYESDFNTGYELLSYAEIPLLGLNHAVSFALTCLLVRQLILHPKSGQPMEAG